jgi:glucose repression mediator protein
MANHHPSPTMVQMQHQQQVAPPPPPPPQGVPPPAQYNPAHQINAMNETVWLHIGSLAEVLRVPEEAMHAYEKALQANPQSIQAMNSIGLLLKGREVFDKALDFFRTIVHIEPTNGEAWGNLGHCFLMVENLQKAYDAYQQALVNLRDPKDPMLWYGIGILYDRYGSYDYAEEAFSQVMHFAPDFEKANEIYFRLGIIYKQQSKYNQSLDCFKYIVNSPPGPLTQEDIWFQIGHVHEQQKDFDSAKAAYQRVLDHSPHHAKVLQQLGWLHHQQSNAYETQDRAIGYLEKSVASDNSDAQSWYLLGRCYMSQQKYPKAYEAYQQAVYRDGKNPTFWCSIGVLYYQINQYRDALDAYSRAIRFNPYISEVWYDLGTLYESCNNQTTDALDAYQRAAELDPTNPHIKARLQLLRSGTTSNGGPPPAPQPADVHPHAYQSSGPVGPQWGGSTQQQSNSGGHPPVPPGSGESWAGMLSNVNPPSQPQNGYGGDRGGEPFRAPAAPIRQPSPMQQDQHSRPPYGAEGQRGPPPPRRQSPPPAPHQYGAPPPPPPPPSQPQAPGRVANPNWSGATPSAAVPPPTGANGAAANGVSSFRPTNSPRPDGRPPLHDARMPSPKSAYTPHGAPPPPPHYAHHPDASSQSASESGPPPPPPMADAGRLEERPASVGPKRMREWEEDTAVKKQASDENRARLDEMRPRRASTPPREYKRTSPEVRRGEDQRRTEEPRRPEEPQRDVYHPSEAAHHPQNHSVGVPNHLPAMQQGPPSDKGTPVAPAQKEERPASAQGPGARPPPPPPAAEPERAARKMDVDEDYDDSGEDEKKAGAVANGSGPGSTAGDAKNGTPGSGGVNGTGPVAPKTEP